MGTVVSQWGGRGRAGGEWQSRWGVELEGRAEPVGGRAGGEWQGAGRGRAGGSGRGREEHRGQHSPRM